MDPTTCENLNINEFNHPRWEGIWKNGLKPGEAFDAVTPSPLLVKYLTEGSIPEGRALVPGCGRGYDVTALANSSRVVYGLEISETAVDAAKSRLSSLSESECQYKENARFELVNFFDLTPTSDTEKYDFVYDYTFLCALDPSIREGWASKMAEVVKPGGLLLTLIFPINEVKVGGPPHKVSLEVVKNLLEPLGFECEELRLLPPELCHPTRDGSPGGHGASGVGRWRRK